MVSSVELWHNEMAGGSIGEHSAGIGFVVGADSGKARQQPMVQIDDPAPGEFPAAYWGENPHITCQDNVVDIVLVTKIDDVYVIGNTILSCNVIPRHAKLLGEAAAFVAVADHDNRFCFDDTVTNRTEQG